MPTWCCRSAVLDEIAAAVSMNACSRVFPMRRPLNVFARRRGSYSSGAIAKSQSRNEEAGWLVGVPMVMASCARGQRNRRSRCCGRGARGCRAVRRAVAASCGRCIARSGRAWSWRRLRAAPRRRLGKMWAARWPRPGDSLTRRGRGGCDLFQSRPAARRVAGPADRQQRPAKRRNARSFATTGRTACPPGTWPCAAARPGVFSQPARR